MDIDFTKQESIVEFFDYVIVGAGPSAMGILRGLLEDLLSKPDSTLSIALVERGKGPPHDATTQSPESWFDAANSSASESVQLFVSEITGRTMDLPVGQGLGGTSNVNACLCLPPLQQDLKAWPEPYQSSLVSTANYLQYVMEDNDAIQHTSIPISVNPFSENNSFLDFCTTVPTMATRGAETHRFVRRNYYDSLVEPFLKKHPSMEKHLHWFRGYEAQRLLVMDTRVIGIECIPTNCDVTYRELHAKKRVILCSGAIETPSLLLVSNLGDREPLLGVGQNLTDQALVARVYIKSPSIGEAAPTSPNGIAALGHLYIAKDGGAGESQTFQFAVADAVANVSIIPSVVPMALRWKCQNKILTEILEIIFRCIKATLRLAILFTPLGFLLRQLTTTTMVFLMHPRSRGSVTISRKDSNIDTKCPKRRRDFKIKADPKYLQDPQDVEAFKAAWDALGTSSSSSIEMFPSLVFSVFKLFRNKNFWFESYCRCFLLPYYHFSGTCAMISSDNPNWVVDSSLKVRGHEGLYICDASVFPAMISNPPALTCASLGYAFARSIVVEDNGEK